MHEFGLGVDGVGGFIVLGYFAVFGCKYAGKHVVNFDGSVMQVAMGSARLLVVIVIGIIIGKSLSLAVVVGCISGRLLRVEAVAFGQYGSQIIGISVILVVGKIIIIVVFIVGINIRKLSLALLAMDCISGCEQRVEAVSLVWCGL